MKKIKVEVCVGTSCHLMGSPEILSYLESLPDNIQERVDVGIVACMNMCEGGPRVKVGSKILTRATPEKVKEAIESELSGKKAGE